MTSVGGAGSPDSGGYSNIDNESHSSDGSEGSHTETEGSGGSRASSPWAQSEVGEDAADLDSLEGFGENGPPPPVPPRDHFEMAEDTNEVFEEALENDAGDEAEPPPLHNYTAKDLTKEVNEKVKTFTEDQKEYEHFLSEKKGEALGNTVVLTTGAIVAGCVVVSMILIVVFSGGLAAGLFGAAAAGFAGAQGGVHAATYAGDGREAKKAKGRMEDQIESDKDFVKQLRMHDNDKKITDRDFSYLDLDANAKQRLEDDYRNEPLKEATRDLTEIEAPEEAEDADDGLSVTENINEFEEAFAEEEPVDSSNKKAAPLKPSEWDYSFDASSDDELELRGGQADALRNLDAHESDLESLYSNDSDSSVGSNDDRGEPLLDAEEWSSDLKAPTKEEKKAEKAAKKEAEKAAKAEAEKLKTEGPDSEIYNS